MKSVAKDKRIETCQVRMERVADAVKSYSRAHKGIYPEELALVSAKDDLYCVFSDADDKSGRYRYASSTSSFTITCKHRGHRTLGQEYPVYRSD